MKAWRELSEIRASEGESLAFADAQRRLAAVYSLKGEREPAFAARRVAVEAFAANGRPADAAIERLAMADHRRNGAKNSEAIELARSAAEDAGRAERPDLTARALGTEGVAQARLGHSDEGLAIVRRGLALALEHDLTVVAAELYQRLGMVLYGSADYRRAEEALDEALGLCQVDGEPDTEVACVTCLIYVLRERGEWSRAGELSRELIATDTAVWVAEGILGAMHGFQGKFSSARRMLASSLATSAPVGHFHMWVDSTAGLAYVAAAEGAHDEAARALPGADRTLGGERGPSLLDLGPAVGRGLPGAARRPRRRARLHRGAHPHRLRDRHPVRAGRPRAGDRRDGSARGRHGDGRRAVLARGRDLPRPRRPLRDRPDRAARRRRPGRRR